MDTERGEYLDERRAIEGEYPANIRRVSGENPTSIRRVSGEYPDKVTPTSGGGRYFRMGEGEGGQAFCGFWPQFSRFALQLTLLVNAYGYVIEHL